MSIEYLKPIRSKVVLRTSHREYRSFVGNGTGVKAVLPVIVTDQGVLDQFAHYMFLNRLMSRSWQDSATFAVQLLLEYAEANHGLFETPRSLFAAFTDALRTGTIENYCDSSGLWWQPRHPEDASKLNFHITRFSDWLSAITGDSKVQLNPWRQATRHEQRLNWAAYCHRRDNAFLSHLWRGKPQTEQSRAIRAQTLPVESTTPPKCFPDEKFDLLLTEGFRRRSRGMRGSTDLRNTLISLLIHYGGLRLSEALSIWTSDVSVEAGEVVVRVYHPQNGLAPDRTMRSAHLERQYGLRPRNTLVKAQDPLFLGWKNCLITDPELCCFEVLFFPIEAGNLFAELWREYHLTQRVKPKGSEDHPYAFTNKDGQPYSHRMFRRAHELAINRIGLEYGKTPGTTPHGHRHAYGQRLARDGASPLLIRFAMHHKSLASAQVYTQPSSKQLRQSLRQMEEKLKVKYANSEFLKENNEE